MRYIYTAALLAGLMATGGLATTPALAQGAPSVQAQVPTIAPSEFRQMIRNKAAYFLIDVRQPDEFAAGHIDGAVLMPLDQLPQTYKRIPKGITLVVYCRSGHRSAQAVSFLRENGYTKAISLNGGYLAWQSH